MLNVEGFIKLDLERISGYLKTLADLELEMTGATQIPFAIKATSVNGKWVDLPKQS